MLGGKNLPPARCAIVLAAGNGQRLQSVVHQLRGNVLPKQYVNFIGTRSMLEHTFERVELVIPKERIFTVVSRDHLCLPDVRRQLCSRPNDTVIAQPQNKETAPGVLLPLIHVYKRCPDSTVAIFPSDHFIVERELFMHHVLLALHAVEREPSMMVLLGIEGHEPHTEYGYIVPQGEKTEPWGLERVKTFVEKPKLEVARRLVAQGALWNTMVTVFKTSTFLERARSLAPELFRSFEHILEALGTPEEEQVVEELYRNMSPVNFSRDLLEALPARSPGSLYVLPVRGVYWSDLGLPISIRRILGRATYLERLHRSPEVSEKAHVSLSRGTT